MEAIIFKGKVSYRKDICFGPHTLIPQEFCCNIIQNIVFFKTKIFWNGDVEVLTYDSRGELIYMASHKDFLKLGFSLNNNVVIKVGIKLVHNLSYEPRDIGDCRLPTPILN